MKTPKKSSLTAALSQAAGGTRAARTPAKLEKPGRGPGGSQVVQVGAHYPPEVSGAIRLIRAQPRNIGRTTRDLLGEAINLLCEKYGVPAPYRIAEP